MYILHESYYVQITAGRRERPSYRWYQGTNKRRAIEQYMRDGTYHPNAQKALEQLDQDLKARKSWQNIQIPGYNPSLIYKKKSSN